jgi:hypothetical protein
MKLKNDYEILCIRYKIMQSNSVIMIHGPVGKYSTNEKCLQKLFAVTFKYEALLGLPLRE